MEFVPRIEVSILKINRTASHNLSWRLNFHDKDLRIITVKVKECLEIGFFLLIAITIYNNLTEAKIANE